MPSALFQKIIHELEAIPEEYPFDINLSRVNEPFCDARIFDFISHILQRLPRCQVILFSNGSLLSKNLVAKLLLCKNIKIVHISFNDHRPDNYEKTMQLPYWQTYNNIKYLHDQKSFQKIPFTISLDRVGDRTVADLEFREWCREKFPCFSCSVTDRFSWLGQTRASNESENVPDVGCLQWYKLHILANGQTSFCCIDEEGRFGHGNVNDSPILDLYRNPIKKVLRTQTASRKEFHLCSKCTLLG